MSPSTPFTFGIALTPKRVAVNWTLIEALLNLSLLSVLGQTDQDFRVLVFGHDRPKTVMDDDSRYAFQPAEWPVQPSGPHNDDSGRKKHLINDFVLEQGGGLLMLLDADDWVDQHVVAASRDLVGGEAVGAVIEGGYATDFQSLRTAPLPQAQIFDAPFFRLCGSSTVALLRPDDAHPVRRDPFTFLRSHHQWPEAAEAAGVRLARLPVSGTYLVNTSENHSDLEGPHTAWRQGFIEAVNALGVPLASGDTERFGLRLDDIRSASRQFFGPQVCATSMTPR